MTDITSNFYISCTLSVHFQKICAYKYMHYLTYTIVVAACTQILYPTPEKLLSDKNAYHHALPQIETLELS